jgi:hypothetical protein
MKKITNYKIQISNKLQITNYKFQTMHLCPKKKQVQNHNIQNHKGIGVFEVNQALNRLIIKSIKPKGSHGLPKDSFKLQTMTALIKSFCGGSRGAVFSKRAPLVAEGRRKNEI